jgi:hypothetical protein
MFAIKLIKVFYFIRLINLFETFLRGYERAGQLNFSDEIFEEAKYEIITLVNDLLTSCCIDPLVVNE